MRAGIDQWLNEHMALASANRAHLWLDRVRIVLVGIAATVPIVIVWPPDSFDPYYGIKALVIIAVGACLLAWWSVALAVGFIRLRRLGPVAILGLVFVMLLVVSSLWSKDPAMAVWGSPGREDGLLVWLSGLLLMATAATLRDERSWRFILTWVAITAMMVSAYGVLQRFGVNPLDPLRWLQYGRSYSTLRNPIFLGGYLALVLPPVVWWCAGRKTGVTRVAAGAGLGVCLAALYFAFSRAGWIGAAAGVGGLAVWWLVRDRAQLRVAVAALLLALVMAVALALIPIAHSEVSGRHSLGKDAQTIVDIQSPRNAGRLALWSIAVDMIKDHPWLGLGLDQMGEAFPGYRTTEFTSAEGADGVADRVHSDPLHLAVVAGIPAAIVFYAMVIVVLIRACSMARRVGMMNTPMWVPVLCGVAGYLLQSVVSIAVPGVHTLLFVLLGALVAARSMADAPGTAIEGIGVSADPAQGEPLTGRSVAGVGTPGRIE